MLEAALSPITRAAETYVSVANALHVGLLKKLGLLKDGVFRFEETLGSDESFNFRPDTGKNAPFLFHAVADADLKGFLDPTNEDGFLSWTLGEDSYVTLPGVVENGPVTRGAIKLRLYKSIEYAFEFAGHDGTKYYYKGVKNLRSLRVVDAWGTLTGSVHRQDNDAKVLESRVFSNQDPSLSAILPFLKSLRLM